MGVIHERTLVIIKPDGVSRGLVGEILARFEKKGLSIAGMKLIKVDTAVAEKHYAEHAAKPFFKGLVSFITSAPAVVIALEGQNAVEVVRNLLGPTSGLKAPGGTIRGDYSISMQNNLVHASDSVASATRELELWFKANELVASGAGSNAGLRDWFYSGEDRAK